MALDNLLSVPRQTGQRRADKPDFVTHQRAICGTQAAAAEAANLAAEAANFALAAEAASLALAALRPVQSLPFRLLLLVLLLPLGCKEDAMLSNLCSRVLLPNAAFQALTFSALEVER